MTKPQTKESIKRLIKATSEYGSLEYDFCVDIVKEFGDGFKVCVRDKADSYNIASFIIKPSDKYDGLVMVEADLVKNKGIEWVRDTGMKTIKTHISAIPCSVFAIMYS